MKTVMFWSCAGLDAAELSFGAAGRLSTKQTTLIAELPCLGIPRLGFACGVMDAEKNTEAAMVYFEQKGSLQRDLIYSISPELHVLCASVYTAPDCPLVSKVKVDKLAAFVAALGDLAQSMDCGYLVLECQGQISSPMTFFSLKQADKVVVPIKSPSDAAYALSCIKRLTQVYDQPADKFILGYSGF